MSRDLPRNLFERHPKKTMLVMAMVLAGLIIISSETAFRLAGYKPGKLSYSQVDHLVVYDNFHTDASGIFKANPRFKGWAPPVSVNQDGFRSPDFMAARDLHPAILLLGDSFAWGAGASPITASFADLLREAGHVVHNTGIPGVGPTQYEAVAKTYIPRLHPDVVIVAFYMGNDFLEKPEPMVPNHNWFYVTNAGWIMGFNEKHQPLSAEEAYRHYVDSPKQRIKVFLARTSIGTLIYNFVINYRHAPGNPSKSNNQNGNSHDKLLKKPWDKYLYTIDCLRNIQTLAKSAGSKFYLLVIPSLGPGCCTGSEVKDYYPVFDQLNPIYLKGLHDGMYTSAPDCHFNNQGHRQVSEEIVRTLKNSRPEPRQAFSN
jgi:hypothetical protein